MEWLKQTGRRSSGPRKSSSAVRPATASWSIRKPKSLSGSRHRHGVGVRSLRHAAGHRLFGRMPNQRPTLSGDDALDRRRGSCNGGAMPRLCYHRRRPSSTEYFRTVLAPMIHPRTGLTAGLGVGRRLLPRLPPPRRKWPGDFREQTRRRLGAQDHVAGSPRQTAAPFACCARPPPPQDLRGLRR
jgi:hypothetical protein